MPTAWPGAARFTISTTVRAVAAWNRIQDKPSSIVIYRNEAALAAQTIRIEYESIANEKQTNVAESSERELILFGVKGHPTATDTDLENGDLFVYQSQQYKIEDVVTYPGEVQAKAKRYT